jgi:hypothetical protein
VGASKARGLGGNSLTRPTHINSLVQRITAKVVACLSLYSVRHHQRVTWIFTSLESY